MENPTGGTSQNSLSRMEDDLEDKFANKCLGHQTFSKWFPLKPRVRGGSRSGEKYHEEYASCNRLRDTPIFYATAERQTQKALWREK